MKKSFCLFLIAGATVIAGLTGCGKQAEQTAQTVEATKPSLPSLDVENAKSVAIYYAACMAAGEYDKASGVAIKDGLEIVNTVKTQPDSKQSKELIAAFEQIAKSFDSVLKEESKDGNTKSTFRFNNVKPVKKIGVKMNGGKYWVYDL